NPRTPHSGNLGVIPSRPACIALAPRHALSFFAMHSNPMRQPQAYRLFIAALCLLLPAMACAQGYISRLLNHPVPGGVAVVGLGPSDTPPKAFYKTHRVMVVRDSDDAWIAVVGIDL